MNPVPPSFTNHAYTWQYLNKQQHTSMQNISQNIIKFINLTKINITYNPWHITHATTRTNIFKDNTINSNTYKDYKQHIKHKHRKQRHTHSHATHTQLHIRWKLGYICINPIPGNSSFIYFKSKFPNSNYQSPFQLLLSLWFLFFKSKQRWESKTVDWSKTELRRDQRALMEWLGLNWTDWNENLKGGTVVTI